MTYRKKLIEVALPLEAINAASAREKSIRHGHPSTLHLWWARRPLAACRAVIFASLVDDPDDPETPPQFIEACRQLPKGKNASDHDTPRMRLFDFIERLVQWESTTDEVILEQARELIHLATEGNPPPLLDPFAGGGSIPLEAQRLGLEAHASDLNPVAVMINKAMIEIPPRFAGRPPVNPEDRKRALKGETWKGAAGLAADVRYYGEWMRERAWERIGHLYPTVALPREQGGGEATVIAWLWARTITCPNPACGAKMPLVTSFELSKKKGKRAWIVFEVQDSDSAPLVRFDIETGRGQPPDPTKLGRGAKFKCLACEQFAQDEYVYSEGRAGRMGVQLLAVVAEGRRGRVYLPPDPVHSATANSAQPTWKPDTLMPDNPRWFSPPLYGMTTFGDLFTDRQLVALTTFSDLTGEACNQIRKDATAAGLPDDCMPLRNGGHGASAYAEAVSVYLGLAVDRSADFWGSLAFWANQPKNEIVAHVFGRQALPMVWDFAEANPFCSSGGNWQKNLDFVAKALSSSSAGMVEGTAVQADAADLTGNFKGLISTDPPYYDNIGYADLSDYFYVWMRRSLRSVFPDIFGTMLVPKNAELVATPYRFDGDAGAANRHFESGLQTVFTRLQSINHRRYPLTVYYAFKQAERVDGEVASTGWETMLQSLLNAGFSIAGTWPIRTERTIGLKGSTNMLEFCDWVSWEAKAGVQ